MRVRERVCVGRGERIDTLGVAEHPMTPVLKKNKGFRKREEGQREEKREASHIPFLEPLLQHSRAFRSRFVRALPFEPLFA